MTRSDTLERGPFSHRLAQFGVEVPAGRVVAADVIALKDG